MGEMHFGMITYDFDLETVCQYTAGSLDLPPLYDEDYGVNEDGLSSAIKLMVELCAD